MRHPFKENPWETIRDIFLGHWADLEATFVKGYSEHPCDTLVGDSPAVRGGSTTGMNFPFVQRYLTTIHFMSI
jgi:hypothetical protein